MALESGLAGQWAAVDETTYGVAPSLAAAKFYACENDSLKLRKVTKQGQGIFAGALHETAARRVVTEYSAGGALPMELPERGMQQWLYRMLGSYGQTKATLTQDGVTGAYQAIHTPGPLEGHTFALQAGRPAVDGGTVLPATYTGCKIMSWDLNAVLGDIVKLTLNIEARNELMGTHVDPLNASVPALQPFTAPLGSVFRWVGGTVFYGGTPSTTAALTAPATPSLATAGTGGTVLAGTYQVIITYVNPYGETVGSTSASITTTGSTSTITVTSPAASGNATGWYAYVTQLGGSTYTRQQAAGSPTAIASNLVLTAPPTSSGAAPNTVNTTLGTTSITSPVVAGNIKGPLTFKYDVPLDLTRYAPDVAPYRNEPLQNGYRKGTGEFTVEFLSAETYYNAYAADTATAVQFQFQTVGIGSGADIATFSIMCPNVRLEGESPSVGGPVVLDQKIPFTVLDDRTNQFIQVTYWTLDAT